MDLEFFTFRASAILPFMSIFAGLFIGLYVERLSARYRQYAIVFAAALVIAGISSLVFSQRSVATDQLIVVINSFLLLTFAVLGGGGFFYSDRLRQHPSLPPETDGHIIQMEVQRIVDDELERLDLGSRVRQHLAQLDINDSQSKILLEYLEMKIADAATSAVNRRINQFTSVMTIVIVILGIFAATQLFNLNDLKNEVTRVLDRSETVLAQTDKEAARFLDDLKRERDQVIGQLIQEAVDQATNEKIDVATQGIVTKVQENAELEFITRVTLDPLQTDVKTLKEEVNALKEHPLISSYQQSQQIQAQVAPAPP